MTSCMQGGSSKLLIQDVWSSPWQLGGFFHLHLIPRPVTPHYCSLFFTQQICVSFQSALHFTAALYSCNPHELWQHPESLIQALSWSCFFTHAAHDRRLSVRHIVTTGNILSAFGKCAYRVYTTKNVLELLYAAFPDKLCKNTFSFGFNLVGGYLNIHC